MVHHAENRDSDDFEMNGAIWDILLSENDESELTQEEKKEIFNLHRYYAHRSGQKLWENLFHPAGTFKCKVCRQFRRTPSRPKVGLPKAKDANEIVSMDLKIFHKAEFVSISDARISVIYLKIIFDKLIYPSKG